MLDAVEFDDDDSLGDAGLVGFHGVAARQETAARSGNSGSRELRIFRQCVAIGDGTIAGNPVSLCHCDLYVIMRNVARDESISCGHCTRRILVSFPSFAVTSVLLRRVSHDQSACFHWAPCRPCRDCRGGILLWRIL